MTYEEFVARKPVPRLCPRCQGPIGPRVDGEHSQIKGQEVCDDCYFDSLGDELDEFPIGRPHRVRC